MRFNLSARRTSLSSFFWLLTPILLWVIFWLPFQMAFIIDIPILTELVSPTDISLSERLVRYSLIWILSAVVAWLVYHRFVRDYEFLKAPRWTLLLYLVPIAAAVNLYLNNPTDIYGVNTIIYLVATFLSVAYQDVLTFGFLQTTLQKGITRLIAAVVTGLVFYVGHLNFGFDLLNLMHILVFAIFAFSRYKTGSIYVTNVIHLTFILAV